jgi:hypothetical protein
MTVLRIVRTCMRCGRQVGMLTNGRCRTWVVDLTPDDVGPVCTDTKSCKLTRQETKT